MKYIYNKYFLFLSCLLFFFILTIQGFDVTDYGYHFTNQYLLLNYPLSTITINHAYLLSDVAGGIWLQILSFPSVLWAKLGGAVLFSLCALISYSILENYFQKKDVFIYVLISTIFLTMFPGDKIINYYTFPAFLILLFLWLFNKVLVTPNDSKQFKGYSALLGGLFPLICLSRITLILMITILPIILIYYFITKRPLKGFYIAIKYALIGLFLSTMVLTFIFYQMNMLNDFILNITSSFIQSASGDIQTFSPEHTFVALIYSYIRGYVFFAIATTLFIIGIFILTRARKYVEYKWISKILILSLIMVLLMTFMTARIGFIGIHLSNGFIGLILLFISIFFLIDKGQNKNLSLLLLISAAIMIINPIGSNTGIVKSTYGFWLALPLSLLCVHAIGSRTKNDAIKFLSSFIPTLLVLMLIMGIFFHGTYIYRDDPNRLHLIHSFESPQLFGIYSSEERVRVSDELISVIEEYSSKGDYLLIINQIPMFYYLTETRPALREPWLFLLSKDRIIELEEKRESMGDIEAKLFIYSKVNTYDFLWPQYNLAISPVQFEKLQYLKERYIGELNYTLLWENEAFAVYAPSTH